MLAKRLAIAFLLEKGYDYRTIQKIIRVSAPTITSVNTARKYGSEGYKKLVAKIIKEEKLISFFEGTVEKLLSIPSELEREVEHGAILGNRLKIRIERKDGHFEVLQ